MGDNTLFGTGAVPVHAVRRTLNLTANGTVTLQAGEGVTKIWFRNDTANAVTGGIRVGTTDGGADVLAAGAVAASAVVGYAPLITAVNPSAARTLYVQAVTAWNSAQVDVAVEVAKAV